MLPLKLAHQNRQGKSSTAAAEGLCWVAELSLTIALDIAKKSPFLSDIIVGFCLDAI